MSLEQVVDRYLLALERIRSTHQFARLFALVDGLQYEASFGEVLRTGQGIALFAGTPDEPLAHAGPWLIDVATQSELCATLADVESTMPVCSWLITSVPVAGLAQLLQNRLDMKLPDGKVALIRYYDPRVLRRLALTLKPDQRETFFEHIDEWHFMVDGQAWHVGRNQ